MKFIVLAAIAVFSFMASAAVTVKQARSAASLEMGMTASYLEQETALSYFFRTESFGDEDHPCFLAVVIDKETGLAKDPGLDEEVNTSFAYADSFQEGNVLRVCAD